MLIITSQLCRVVTAGTHVPEGESPDTMKISCGNRHSTVSGELRRCGIACHTDDKAEGVGLTDALADSFVLRCFGIWFWCTLIGNSAELSITIMSSHNYPHFCVQRKIWIHCKVTAQCYLIDGFNQRAVVWLNDNCYLQETISAADDNKLRRANEMSGGVHW